MGMHRLLSSIIILLIFFSFKSNAQTEISSKDTLRPEMYRIKKIKKIKNVYLIFALKDGKKYEIVSPKGGKPDNCEKIVNGEKYYLVLIPYFKNNDFSRFTVTHIEIKGTVIPIEIDVDNNIYFTSNLSGLYYTPPKK
jgi:hypothetical protein